jgi:ABC-2 type transport system permease protein
MRTILYIIRKEFKQIFRNKSMLPIIFVMPIIQLIVLVNAATMEMKSIKMVVVDNDLSQTSRKFIGKFEGSPFYVVNSHTFSIKEAEKQLKSDEIDVILNIPSGFERNLFRNNSNRVQVIINAINGMVAGISNAYIQGITAGYNIEVITQIAGKSNIAQSPANINITNEYWYNPQLNYKNFMVPAVLVLLITMIGLFLSGMNLVREKELGTIEQINVTPIKKYQFIAGKLIPFWILALVELAFGLIIGKFLFSIPILGSIPLLFSIAALYLLVILSIGLFISTTANTQQQSMFVSFFFAIVFIMLSGVFTAVESMPEWAQWLDRLNPIYYFMRIVRMIILKGSGFTDVFPEVLSLFVFAVILLTLSVKRYKKTT